MTTQTPTQEFPWSAWIGVDLDGTLSKYDGWQGVEHIGEPIPAMIEKVRAALTEGIEVRIMTARVCGEDGRDVPRMITLIQDWCEQHIGARLQVTNRKDPGMLELWDDRVRRVICNTGEFADEKTF